MYFKKIKELYDQIELKELRTINLNEVKDFELTVKVAFCKSVQINQIIHQELFDKNSFLYLSTLRGICEEIIVLKFIDDLFIEQDKDELIKAICKSSVQKELKEQSNFIGKYRPGQPLLDESLSNYLVGEEIQAILNRNGINGNKIPPTAQMADRIGLKELYDFIYRGSCSFVHFSPRIMQRTVWYENNESEIANISITNFNKYYFSFSSFYGSYLMGVLYKNFKKYLHINKEQEKIIKKIINSVREKVHYPELVTFEEFNLKRPKTELTIINQFLKNQIFDEDDHG